MLEYFAYKKVKKHRAEQAASRQQEKGKQVARDEIPKREPGTNTAIPQRDHDSDGPATEGTPVLDHEDEEFLERLTSSTASLGDNEDETPPPLPPRVKTPVIEIDSDTSSLMSRKENENTTDNKQKPPPAKPRFTFMKAIPRSISLRKKSTTNQDQNHLSVPRETNQKESEDKNLSRVLDDLDLASRNNRAISLSAESASLAHTFTQVLRDLVNGVPTAYADLTHLLDDKDGLLSRNYARLPSSLKKLVSQLPEKLTSTLAPELLAVAAEAQAIGSEEGVQSGLKSGAKKFLSPANLRDLVSKPGAIVGLLKGIMNVLKTRFPAFVGTNVLWSLAVFLLLSMLWYCYKRGREERLEREAREKAETGESSSAGGTGEGPDVAGGNTSRNTDVVADPR
ncbi:hypothetical protein GGS21DRAFT_226192 [Xylaria nigripes]|nr:hypothetical protein GGS21DRAFT_226192 [Xylaria nigripes]